MLMKLEQRRSYSWLLVSLVIIMSIVLTSCSEKNQKSTPENDSNIDQETTTTADKIADEQTIAEDTEAQEKIEVRVGLIKGPTGMGSAKLMENQEQGQTRLDYKFTIAGAPTDLVGLVTSGNLDIVFLPTNVAATLYNKTEGKIKLVNVNALGVMSIVSCNGKSYEELSDLKGTDIVSAGQGAAPDFVFNYILEGNGLVPGEDINVDFKSEHTEVASLLLGQEYEVAILAEPFTTSVLRQDEACEIAFDLTDEWEKVAPDQAKLVMASAIARTEFLEEYPGAIDIFLEEFNESQQFVNANPEAAGELIEKFDIIKADVAKEAIPRSHILSMTGEEMQKNAKVYLEVIYGHDPKSVGGKLPDDDFYYLGP